MSLRSHFITAVAGLTLGIGGTVLMLGGQHETASAPAGSSAPAAPRNANAVVTAIPADNVVHVRAHTWVGQFAFVSVCARGRVAAPKPCDYEADFGGAPAIGASLTLNNLQPATGAIAPHRVEVVMPALRPRQDVMEGPIKARVVKLVDGDTVEIEAEPFPGHYVLTDVRIGGIDTPEKKGRAKCAGEAALAEQASAATRDLIAGREVQVLGVQFEKYGGRVLGTIRTLEGVDAGQNLIRRGLAHPYDGGTKQTWCPAS